MNRVVVLTGASSGIGAVTARRLADDGARVVVVGRNQERTTDVARSVGGDPLIADFDRLDDVRSLAAELLRRYERIDVLLNNAGGISARHELTVDGFERTIQANHLAPFLLTNLLLPRIRQSAAYGPTRVVSTASTANRYGRLRLDDLNWEHRPWLGGWGAYGASKLATILFIRQLAERTAGTGVSAYSVHPGLVVTSFGMQLRTMRLASAITGGHYGISAEAGAEPLVRLAGEAPIGAPSGTYFDRFTAGGHVSARATDALGRELWDLSARLTGC